MRKLLIISVLLLFVGGAESATFDSDIAFYSSRPRQFFKSDDARPLLTSMDESDDVPYWSWQGPLSGREIVLELHGNTLSFSTGKLKKTFELSGAFAFPDQTSAGFDPRGVDLFVKSMGLHGPDIICIESLIPFASKSIPFREVYVLVSAPGRASFYRLTGRNAACSGLEVDARQNLLIPKWDVHPPSSNRFRLAYFRLMPTGFSRTGESYAGEFLKADQFDFKIDDRPR